MSAASITEEQKAYHLRKMRTLLSRHEVQQDGYISLEDYTLMAKKFIENTGATGEKAESLRQIFMDLCDMLGLEPGGKRPLEEAARKNTEVLLSWTPQKQKAEYHRFNDPLFDAMDGNNDGYISADEFKMYHKIFAPAIAEEDVAACFRAMDCNGDGLISREDFYTAVTDFYYGLEIPMHFWDHYCLEFCKALA